MFLLLAVQGGPLHFFSTHGYFSAEMGQEALTYYVVAPLIVLAIPMNSVVPILQQPLSRKVFRFFTNPVTAQLSFYFVYYIYHIPIIYLYVIHHSYLGFLIDTLLLILGVFLWWPIFSRLPGFQSITRMRKVIYLVTNSLLIIGAIMPLIMLDKIPMYAENPELLIFSNKDIFAGAFVLIVVQKFVYAAVIGWLIHQWVKKDQKVDPPYSKAMYTDKFSFNKK